MGQKIRQKFLDKISRVRLNNTYIRVCGPIRNKKFIKNHSEDQRYHLQFLLRLYDPLKFTKTSLTSPDNLTAILYCGCAGGGVLTQGGLPGPGGRRPHHPQLIRPRDNCLVIKV